MTVRRLVSADREINVDLPFLAEAHARLGSLTKNQGKEEAEREQQDHPDYQYLDSGDAGMTAIGPTCW
jgi:hypothetical protein